jgi:hypothetical protein
MDSLEIELPSNRKFGLFFTTVLTIAGGYFLTEASNYFAYILGGLAALLLLITLMNSELLLPLNKLWMRLGYLMGLIISPIVLGIIFFVLFTPIGMFMRILGRDELRLKPKPTISYWKVRSPNEVMEDSFKYQF